MSDFDDCEGCVSLTRRGFLKASAILSFAALPDLSLAAPASDTRLMVVLLRGGMDGLHAMPPIGDRRLEALRPHLNPDDVRKLNTDFALHPVFSNVHDIYKKGEALLVHSISLPYTGRSHFEGQDIMESGVMQPYASKSGWIGRSLDLLGYPSVAMSLPVPLIMRGEGPRDGYYPSWLRSVTAQFYRKIAPIWAGDPELATVAREMESQASDLARPPSIYAGDTNSIVSLAGEAGKRMRDADGPRVAVLDHVGFDSHANEQGIATQRMREVDQAIGAFRQAIGDETWRNTLVVTVTEFGRTAHENGSWGTDHGWGTSVFVLGGKLKKGGVVADWPGLASKSLYDGRDLMATLDARQLYGAVLSRFLDIDPERVRREVLDFQPGDTFEPYL